jgi:hypothetical protein
MPRPKGSSNGLLLMPAILGFGSTFGQKLPYIAPMCFLIINTILLLLKSDNRNKVKLL